MIRTRRRKCFAVLFLIGILLSAVACPKVHADSLYIIRVGLTKQLKQQSSVKVSTKKIALGYCVNNRFSEYIHFTNRSGFTFSPATGYYLVSDTVYPDYASVIKVYQKLCKVKSLKNSTYVAMIGKNKWSIYVGGKKDVQKVMSLQEKAEAKSKTTFSVSAYNGHRIKVSGGSFALLYDGDETGQYVQISANVLNKKGSKTLTVNGYEYRGRMEIGTYGAGKLTVVNITNVENYLRSVVGSEMDSSYPMEALKAQAIVSRTFAQNHCDNSGDTNTVTPYTLNDTDHVSTTSSQQYGGYAKERKDAVLAVTSTRGICIYDKGSQIDAAFFPSSGGRTEDAVNIWGTKRNYLLPVADVMELSYAGKAWRKDYTPEQLGQLVGLKAIVSAKVDAQTASGRLDAVTFTDTEQKSITLKHDNIRVRLGLNSTKCRLITKKEDISSLFLKGTEETREVEDLTGAVVLSANKRVTTLAESGTVVVAGKDNTSATVSKASVKDGVYTFVGLGNGHGAGMSQAGAKARALAGQSAENIIRYYYGPSVSMK